MSSSVLIEDSLFQKIKSLMPIPCVDLLIVHDNRLLLMLRNNEPAKDQWFTPGGRIFLGESLEEAVYRVLDEETGLKPLHIQQKGTMSHLWPNVHTVTAFYHIEVADDKVKMNNEHRDYKWVTEPPRDLHPYLKEMINKANLSTTLNPIE